MQVVFYKKKLYIEIKWLLLNCVYNVSDRGEGDDPAGSRGCWDFLKRPPDMLEPPDFVQIGYLCIRVCIPIFSLIGKAQFRIFYSDQISCMYTDVQLY